MKVIYNSKSVEKREAMNNKKSRNQTFNFKMNYLVGIIFTAMYGLHWKV